ncbi:hypothetical protein ABIS04_01775 [Shewanella sp. H8]|uniref:hypothetical protein n=1 Tax=Shewanella sp. H8 TaxID=3342676 RepID=UPI0033152BC2
MYRSICKVVLFGVMMLVSACSSDVSPYHGNQGDTPKVFDSQFFSGQWSVIKAQGKYTHFANRKPHIVSIYQGDLESLNSRITQNKVAGLRLETIVAAQGKSKIQALLNNINEFEYINKHYTSENIDSVQESTIYNGAKPLRKDFVQKNEANTLVFDYYNQNNVVVGLNAFVLFEYQHFSVLRKNQREHFAHAKTTYKQLGLDINIDVDFIMLNDKQNMVGIDVVNDELIIVYNFGRGERNYAILEKVK